MLHQAISGKDGSLRVGSNSPNIIRSMNWETTTTEPPNKENKPMLRAYKRCKNRTKSNTKDDPDYVPTLNHISNSDNGSFKFSRGKGKKNPSIEDYNTKVRS
ncbi:hypothetical protein AHAS_Ahas16G0240700 [Arachis hypogaea]